MYQTGRYSYLVTIIFNINTDKMGEGWDGNCKHFEKVLQ
jgi:hypothetical protein